jgi:hypothetical protein
MIAFLSFYRNRPWEEITPALPKRDRPFLIAGDRADQLKRSKRLYQQSR